ncbi:MAG: VWA domain-containing protein [Verrucomicrobiota bacterium]
MKQIKHILGLAGLIIATPAFAGSVKVDAQSGHATLLAGEKGTTFIKVGLTGKKWERPQTDRAPVNVALVLDKSGSMSGDKLRQAKAAARQAIERLTSNDIVSVIVYDTTVKVVVPATKASDKSAILRQIDAIQTGGSTALFGGVAKGAEEIRKFVDRERVNRIILLSDGLANVGPKSPAALGDLGKSLAKEDISVSTIGLGDGYNEDLMYELANKSDGSHHFAESPQELAGIFDREFGDVLSVVAQKIRIRIQCAEGVRPVRILGREGDIAGQEVFVPLTQIYSEDEQYVILEVEIAPGLAGDRRGLADVSVTYFDLENQEEALTKEALTIAFTDSEAEIRELVNAEVMAAGVSQIATLNNRFAMKLRDQGKIDEAKVVLTDNSIFCVTAGNLWGDQGLIDYGEQNEADAENLEGAAWTIRRKAMVEQQIYNVKGGLQKTGTIRKSE